MLLRFISSQTKDNFIISSCFEEENSEYIYIDKLVNFSQATLSCNSLNATLVKITTFQENNFVKTFSFSVVDNPGFRIGLSNPSTNED